MQGDHRLHRTAHAGCVVIGRRIRMTQMRADEHVLLALSGQMRFHDFDASFMDLSVDPGFCLRIRRIAFFTCIAFPLQLACRMQPGGKPRRDDKAKCLVLLMVIPPEAGIVYGIRQILRRAVKIGLIEIIGNDAQRATAFRCPAVLLHLLMRKQDLPFQVPLRIFLLAAAAGHLHDLQRMTAVITGDALRDDLDRIIIIICQIEGKGLDQPACAAMTVPLGKQPVCPRISMFFHRVRKHPRIDAVAAERPRARMGGFPVAFRRLDPMVSCRLIQHPHQPLLFDLLFQYLYRLLHTIPPAVYYYHNAMTERKKSFLPPASKTARIFPAVFDHERSRNASSFSSSSSLSSSSIASGDCGERQST